MLSAPTAQTATQYSFLIIGYGNELRSDDAVGPWVARAVADWQLPAVKSLAVHQLTPELADVISEADYVIFVDACGESCSQTVQLDPLGVDCSVPRATSLGVHSYAPMALLSLTQGLYGHHPQAWLLQIPTECFGLGETLSATAREGCDRALRIIEQFLRTYQWPPLEWPPDRPPDWSLGTSQEPCMKSV
ncbi:MAG: hydrogenase maturation protease [Cyanobacteria bacterium J06635_1]